MIRLLFRLVRARYLWWKTARQVRRTLRDGNAREIEQMRLAYQAMRLHGIVNAIDQATGGDTARYVLRRDAEHQD